MPRRRLIAGENLNRAISASTWNELLSLLDHRDRAGLWEAARTVSRSNAGRPHPDAFLVRNESGNPIERFGLVALNTPLVDADQANGEFDREVVMSAIEAGSNRTKTIAVALDPMPYNGTGYVVATGITQCMVDVGDADHTHCYCATGETYAQSNFGGPWRIVWKPGTGDAQKCLVLLGDPQYVRKARSSSVVTAGSSGTANFYFNGATVGSATVWNDWIDNGGNIGSGTDLFVRWFDDQERWVITGAECGA